MPWWVKGLRGLLVKPERLHDTWVHRMLGSSILRKECWSLKPRSVAVGTAVGIFVCLTPTLGLQLIMVAILCVILRGNIPISMLATFISNPITMVPLFGFILWIGCIIMGDTIPLELWHQIIRMATDFHMEEAKETFQLMITDFYIPLWVGSMVVAIPATFIAYFASYGFALRMRKIHLIASIKERAEARRLRALARREAKLLMKQEKLEDRVAEKLAKLAEKRLKLAETRARVAEDHMRHTHEIEAARAGDFGDDSEDENG